MTPPAGADSSRWTVRALALAGLLALALILVLRCKDGPVPPARVGARTIALDSPSRAALLTIARAQVYDTIPGAGDQQRLLVGAYPGSAAHGPLVHIQPNVVSHTADSSQLASGYVVARWINLDSIPYPKLGSVGRDTTYWFVDSTAAGGWRSRYISTGARSDSVVVDSLMIHPAGTTWTRSAARWIWSDADETGWVTCTSAGCCTSRTTLKASIGGG